MGNNSKSEEQICIFCRKNRATHHVKFAPACWECWYDRKDHINGIPLEEALESLDDDDEEEMNKWVKELNEDLNKKKN